MNHASALPYVPAAFRSLEPIDAKAARLGIELHRIDGVIVRVSFDRKSAEQLAARLAELLGPPPVENAKAAA